MRCCCPITKARGWRTRRGDGGSRRVGLGARYDADRTGTRRVADGDDDNYSSGAIATVWAAQEQPHYAPELRFAGAVAGGTPTDYAPAQEHERRLGAGLFAAATIGQAREYPEMVELFGDFAFHLATLVKNYPQPPLAAADWPVSTWTYWR